MTADAAAPLTLEDVDISGILPTRPSVPADVAAELDVIEHVGRALHAEPDRVLGRLVDGATTLCGAGSGGVSVLEGEGEAAIFRWRGLRGRFQPLDGGTTPRRFSPCGVVLDRLQPVLMARPERLYTYLTLPQAPIHEVLLVPLLAGEDHGIGTIWVVTHDPHRHFTRGEADTLTHLAAFTSVGVAMAAAVAEAPGLMLQEDRLLREVNRRLGDSLAAASALLRRPTSLDRRDETRERSIDHSWFPGSIDEAHRRLRAGARRVDMVRALRNWARELVALAHDPGRSRGEAEPFTEAYEAAAGGAGLGGA